MHMSRVRGIRGLALTTTLALITGGLVLPATAPLALAAPAASIVDSPVGEVYDAQMGPDGTTYAVGDFTEVGAATGGLARLDATNGDVDRDFPTVNGAATAIAKGTDGSLYLGGDFISVGGQLRTDLAKVNPDGSIASWAPQVDGRFSYVVTLAIDDTTLYVGGAFPSIDGQARDALAAFDTETGALLSWAPDILNGNVAPYVYSLAVDGSHLYAGGIFTTIDGWSRTNLVAFTKANQTVDPSWSPNPDYAVSTIEVDGSTIYIGGDFLAVGGQARRGLASVDATTGGVSSWNPGMDGSVSAIAIDDTIAYVGGNFYHANGNVSRMRLAALRTDDTGTLTDWDPNLNLNGNTEDFLLTDTSVYVAAPSLVKVSRAGTGTVDGQWQPRTPDGGSSRFTALVPDGSAILAGGDFTHVNVESRHGAAAFDAGMHTTSWDPDIYGTGYGIELVDATAYVVGDFSTVNGSVGRDYAAAFRTDDTGTATSWAPEFDSYPYDFTIEGSLAYLAGDFGDVNGQTRNYAASVHIDDTGTVTEWDPDIGGSAYGIAVDAGTAYIVGSFSDVKGSTVQRSNAAAFSTTGDGTVTPWSPDPDSDTHEVTIHGGLAYLGGGFTAMNAYGSWGGSGVDRNGAAAVSIDDSGTVTPWNPDVDGPVYAIEISGTHAYVSGDFQNVNGAVSRAGLAALSIDDTGTVSEAWIPVASGGFSYSDFYAGGLRVAGNRLLVMGDFRMATLEGVDYPGALAALPMLPSNPPVPPSPTPSSPPRDVRGTPGDGRVSVTWSAPASPGSYPVTNYEVTSTPGGRTCLVAGPALTCEVTGLTNGTSYTFTAKALTGAGWSEPSAPSAPVTPSPSPGRSIVIAGSRAGQRIEVSGKTTGFRDGAILRPWVKLAGETSYTQGVAQIPVGSDGTFGWGRKTGKKAYIYVMSAAGGVRSNRVTISGK